MIIQSLYSLYEREAGAGKVPAYGYQQQKISIEIEIDDQGRTVSVHKNNPRELPLANVPSWPERTGQRQIPATWCDTAAYVLGVDFKTPKETDHNAPIKHEKWLERHRDLVRGSADPGLVALGKWIDSGGPEQTASQLKANDEKVKYGDPVAFKYEGRWLHERPAARKIWDEQAEDESASSLCIITGTHSKIAGTHPKVRGVKADLKAKAERAALISYNDTAYEHYGQHGTSNASISERAAHGYTAMLESLIARRDCVFLGGTTTVYWTEAQDRDAQDAHDILTAILSGTASASSDEETARLRDILRALATGRMPPPDEPTAPYYLLSIEPGTGRHAIRNFLRSTIGELRDNVTRYLSDISIGADGYTASVWWLAAKAERDKIAPPAPQVRALVRAVLLGERYPLTLMDRVIARVHARDEITKARAAILKATLIRNYDEAITMTLDPEHPSPAYHLGRFLAVAERMQMASNPGVGVTLSARHMSSMMSRPLNPYARIVQDLAHYKAALMRRGKPGLAVALDRELAAISSRMMPIPEHMTTVDQAMLGLGYYQQLDEFETQRKTRTAAKSATLETATNGE